MAGMKRFVTYIYAYEDKKKGNSSGFARIEIRGGDCRIEIHLRGVYQRQSLCKVYLFRENEGKMEGFLIGEMKLFNGSGDFVGIVKAGGIGGSVFGIGDMEGIFLLGEDESIFMSRWKDGRELLVCAENFLVWQPPEAISQESESVTGTVAKLQESESATIGAAEPQESEPATIGATEPQEYQRDITAAAEPQENERATLKNRPYEVQQNTTEVQLHKVEQTTTEKNPQENEQNAPLQAIAGEKSETVQMTEIPVRNVFPGYDWQMIWETLKQSHPVFKPFDDVTAECVQIELKDLRELPKRYWYLGNNSFLLHGFFNYRYLVLGKTGENRWFIGVPGVYQRQERVMAAIFGFPEFIAVKSKETGDKAEPVNRFGCWYRYMEE